MDTPRVATMMQNRKSARGHGVRVFDITPARYRQLWTSAFKVLDLPLMPPHSLRHTGVSRDAYEGYRTLDQIKHRGRWTADSSVARYVKTHSWVVALAQEPDWVRDRAALISADWLPRPPIAKQ